METALECLLEAGQVPTADAVRFLVDPDDKRSELPELEAYEVELSGYDELLDEEEVAS